MRQDGSRQKTGQKENKTGQRESRAGQKDGRQEPSGQGPAQTCTQVAEPAGARKGNPEPDPKDRGYKGSGITGQQEIILMAELNRTGVTLEEVLARYGADSLSQMTPETYSRAIAALKQTKPKGRAGGTAA